MNVGNGWSLAYFKLTDVDVGFSRNLSKDMKHCQATKAKQARNIAAFKTGLKDFMPWYV